MIASNGQLNMAQAAGVVLHGRLAGVAPPPPQLLAQINEAIHRVEKVLQEAGADASMLSDRIFGPVPTAGNTREDRVEHSGFAESILDRLSDLHGLAETVAERTRFLNSRL